MLKNHLENYIGREQAYVKHHLLEKYLSRWAYKIGSSWDLLVFVDGFAGPWGSRDKEFSDASFGIALRVLTEAVEGPCQKARANVKKRLSRSTVIAFEKSADSLLSLVP